MGLWSYVLNAYGRESRATETRVRDLEMPPSLFLNSLISKSYDVFAYFRSFMASVRT